MEKLYQLAKGYTNRFPNGNEPFQITARILEECGEVASEVNHFEKSGIKVQKHGEPSKQHMADEIKQAIRLFSLRFITKRRTSLSCRSIVPLRK